MTADKNNQELVMSIKFLTYTESAGIFHHHGLFRDFYIVNTFDIVSTWVYALG